MERLCGGDGWKGACAARAGADHRANGVAEGGDREVVKGISENSAILLIILEMLRLSIL